MDTEHDIKWDDIQRMIGVVKQYSPIYSGFDFFLRSFTEENSEKILEGIRVKISEIYQNMLVKLNTKEVIEKIMGDVFINGLLMEDRVKILLLSLSSRDLSCLYGLQDNSETNKFSQVMLKRVRKCLKILKNKRESIIHAFAYTKYAYYLQGVGGDVALETLRVMLVRSYSILLKRYPQILSMGPSEFGNIPTFEQTAINEIFEGRICLYFVKGSEEKTLQLEEIKKEILGICHLYERLSTTNEFNPNTQLLHRKRYSHVLELTAKCFEHFKEFDKSTKYLENATEVRNSIFQDESSYQEIVSFLPGGANSSMDFLKRKKRMNDAEVELRKIRLLIKAKKYDEIQILLENLHSKKDTFDQHMHLNYEIVRSIYFRDIGEYVQHFNSLNRSIELHLKSFGWTHNLTHRAIMERLHILLLIGEKKAAMKDIRRMKKYYSLFNIKVREEFRKFEKVATQSDICFEMTDHMKRHLASLYELKKLITSKKKKEKKDLRYQNNRICSNDICSNYETLKKRFKVCSACKVAGYCSRKCQKVHWKHHKLECSDWKLKTK